MSVGDTLKVPMVKSEDSSKEHAKREIQTGGGRKQEHHKNDPS